MLNFINNLINLKKLDLKVKQNHGIAPQTVFPAISNGVPV